MSDKDSLIATHHQHRFTLCKSCEFLAISQQTWLPPIPGDGDADSSLVHQRFFTFYGTLGVRDL